MADRRGMGALEGAVLGQLWAAGRPLSPSEVRTALADELAYTTVLTVLTRLWHKKLVAREARGRTYVYWPLVSEADLTAQRMRSALERSADRESALASFVGSLSPNDGLSLRHIIGLLDSEG